MRTHTITLDGKPRRPAWLLLLALLFTMASFMPPAMATSHVRVELVDAGWLDTTGRKTVPGLDAPARARLAAVVVRLQPGWKTYWRMPGDGGVPPRFDFSGSENLEAVHVLWPAPTRHTYPMAGDVIGYENTVVFPLLVIPADPARPVRLSMRLDFGVCGKICMPATATATLVLPPRASPNEQTRQLVLSWLGKTPFFDPPDLQVRDARLEERDGRLNLLLTLSGPRADRVSDILVEGMDLAVFGKPRKVRGDDGSVTYALPVRGLAERKDFRGARLRLTILLGDRAIERVLSLP